MDKLTVLRNIKHHQERQDALNDWLMKNYPEEDALEIKQLIAAHFAEKLRRQIDEQSSAQGWDGKYFEELANGHDRVAEDGA